MFLPYTCKPRGPAVVPPLWLDMSNMNMNMCLFKRLKIWALNSFVMCDHTLQMTCTRGWQQISTPLQPSARPRMCSRHLCGNLHLPICQCQICNFSSSQSEMAGPPRYFINNLQITAEQKMVMHRSECEPRPGRASFLSQRSISMKNAMCQWCNCVCVCVYCVPKGSP